jgi:hypothetical protein
MRNESNSNPNTNGRSRDAISPDVDKGKPITHCKHCGKALFAGDIIGRSSLTLLCEACTDEANSCIHESGTVSQHYDENGCGFHVWSCDRCGFKTFDDL